MVPTKCIIPEVNVPTAAQIIMCAVFWFLNFQISVSDCVLHMTYMFKTHKSNFHWYLSMAAQNPWQEVNLNFLKQECVSKSRPASIQHAVSPPDYLQCLHTWSCYHFHKPVYHMQPWVMNESFSFCLVFKVGLFFFFLSLCKYVFYHLLWVGCPLNV